MLERMLLRRDSTYIDEATKQARRIFPDGTAWLYFQSRLPAPEVFKNTVLDGAIGVAGELGLATFANAEWQNWTSSVQVLAFELGTRIGLPEIEGQPFGRAIASIFDAMPMSISHFRDLDDPLVMVPELLKSLALQVVQLLTMAPSLVAQVVGQVLAVAVWLGDFVTAALADQVGKDLTLPPLQAVEPETDSWQVNRVFEVLRKQGSGEIQFPDGSLQLASNADYSSLFMPAYVHRMPWKFQWREGGIAAQQGMPKKDQGRGREGLDRYQFDIGDGSTFGFMPGAGVMLRVLQASTRYYATLRGNPVDRFTLRCRDRDRGCWQSAKVFDGSRDCRQCVTAESVWPVKGLGWAYAVSPLNVTTPGENVGEFYSATNKLISNVLDLAARPGPLLYTIDAVKVRDAWKLTFENFWEFMRAEWHRYKGWGWRGLLSRLSTLMVAFEDKGALRLGGRFPAMPVSLIPNVREQPDFSIGFEHSIFSRVIEPFCVRLGQLQHYYLDTTEVAYIPPGAGALYTSEGKLKKSKLALEFQAARTELLGTTKRMLVDLRRVTDPEYRRLLEKAGVKASPVNQALQGSPGVQFLVPDIKPPRAPTRPKTVTVPPLAGANELVRANPERAKPARAKPARADTGSNAAALGIAAASVVAVGGAAWWLHRESRGEPKPDGEGEP
jgi:hypothetical protein